MDSDFLLQLSEVSYHASQIKILKEISFELLPHQLVTLIGPNGAGKSTLIKLILGLLRPSSGSIQKHPSLRIGYMPQKFSLNPLLKLTVERFLQLARNPQFTIKECLATVSGEHLLKKSLHTLSGGETQRVLLANALITLPHLLVLDEPTQGLDIDGQRLFYTILDKIRASAKPPTILLASHDLYMVLKTSDQVICLNQHVCCMGHPDTIRYDPHYLHLFGDQTPVDLTLYHHHHTHHH